MSSGPVHQNADPAARLPGRIRPYLKAALVLIPSRRARVRDDLAEVVEALDRFAAPAEEEVGAAQHRPVLRVAAEVGGGSRQVVAEPPDTASVTLLILDAVLEGTVERVEDGGSALVRDREQVAPHAGGPARPALDSR